MVAAGERSGLSYSQTVPFSLWAMAAWVTLRPSFSPTRLAGATEQLGPVRPFGGSAGPAGRAVDVVETAAPSVEPEPRHAPRSRAAPRTGPSAHRMVRSGARGTGGRRSVPPSASARGWPGPAGRLALQMREATALG